MRFVNPFVLCVAFFAAACGTDPAEDPVQQNSLRTSPVVCRTCSPELLASSEAVVRQLLNDFIDFAGAEMPDASHKTVAPTFHLDDDDTCDFYYRRGSDGSLYDDPQGHVCLYLNVDWETDTAPAFTADSVIRQDVLREQVFHAANEYWFYNRFNYQSNWDPFRYMAQLMLIDGVADVCDPVRTDWRGLIPALCELGLEPAMIPAIYKGTADLADEMHRTKDRLPGHEDFVGLVSRILGTDAEPAFEEAWIRD